MAIDERNANPWLLEDLQLRWEACAERQAEAIAIAGTVVDGIPGREGEAFRGFIAELVEFRRRVLAYVHHCRETNLTELIRIDVRAGRRPSPSVVAELRASLEADLQNAGNPDLVAAIRALDDSAPAFADHYFVEPEAIPKPEGEVGIHFGYAAPRGAFSATSR
jgi:hypothetical protein